MSTTQDRTAERLLAEAEDHAAWTAEWAANPSHRSLVRGVAKHAARHGEVSVYDDPLVRVRASQLVEVATDAIELRNLRRLIARLPDDDWTPFDWAVLSLAQEAARQALEDES